MNREHWAKMLPLIRVFIKGRTFAYQNKIEPLIYFTDNIKQYGYFDVTNELQDECRVRWKECLPYVEAFVEGKLVDSRESINFYSTPLHLLKIQNSAPPVGSREHWKVLQPIVYQYTQGCAVTVGGLPVVEPNFLSLSSQYAATYVEEELTSHHLKWGIAYPYLLAFVLGKLTIDGVKFEGVTPLIGELNKFDIVLEYMQTVRTKDLIELARI